MIALLLLFVQEGIAARYPGDEGIEKDPRILFVEDFEVGEVKEIGARWGNIRFPDHMDLAAEVHDASPGRRSLRMALPNGPAEGCDGGHLFTHTRGADRMHLRFYVKFHEKHGYLHHFVMLVADRAPTPWPKGWAGKRPPGDSHFISSIEPWSRWGKDGPPGAWNFYSYWQEMKPDGRGDYWGNSFMPDPPPPVERGRWVCVEAMVKANSAPDAADGEQALWLDGKLVATFKGIRWRSSDKLKLNSIWLQWDVNKDSARHNRDTAPDSRVYEIWFDDVVAATEYIGPVRGSPRSGKKAAGTVRTEEPKPAPGKVVYSEAFGSGPGAFKGGEAKDGALALPPKGANVWGAFNVPVRESTTLRFRLKPLADVGQVQVMVWAEKLKDNARYFITGLKKGEWKEIEFRGVDVRLGWATDGPCLDGLPLDNFTIHFEGTEGARILLDDFEIRE